MHQVLQGTTNEQEYNQCDGKYIPYLLFMEIYRLSQHQKRSSRWMSQRNSTLTIGICKKQTEFLLTKIGPEPAVINWKPMASQWRTPTQQVIHLSPQHSHVTLVSRNLFWQLSITITWMSNVKLNTDCTVYMPWTSRLASDISHLSTKIKWQRSYRQTVLS